MNKFPDLVFPFKLLYRDPQNHYPLTLARLFIIQKMLSWEFIKIRRLYFVQQCLHFESVIRSCYKINGHFQSYTRDRQVFHFVQYLS